MKSYLLKRIKRDNKGCWIWQLNRNQCGYGAFKKEGKTLSTHRESYKAFKGRIPENMCVCHTCDNPPCINPDHLFLGTHGDNMRDMSRKGRQVTKLKNVMVYDIIESMNGLCPIKDCAELVGVSNSYVWGIWNRRFKFQDTVK